MTRYGAQFGPDITFLGVDPVDLEDTAAVSAADVVVVGAPWDGGTSHRPGTRFGPQAIRPTDYLPPHRSPAHLALPGAPAPGHPPPPPAPARATGGFATRATSRCHRGSRSGRGPTSRRRSTPSR